MSYLSKLLHTIGLACIYTASPAQSHSAREIEQARWEFREVICVSDCTPETLSSISPYLGQQLGFGPNRPEFDLLDQCGGNTFIQIQTKNTEQLILSIRNSTQPSQKLQPEQLNLPKPKVHTGQVLCNDPANHLSPDGDIMFNIILPNSKEMLVWFENQIFLRFTISNTLHEHPSPPHH